MSSECNCKTDDHNRLLDLIKLISGYSQLIRRGLMKCQGDVSAHLCYEKQREGDGKW